MPRCGSFDIIKLEKRTYYFWSTLQNIRLRMIENIKADKHSSPTTTGMSSLFNIVLLFNIACLLIKYSASNRISMLPKKGMY